MKVVNFTGVRWAGNSGDTLFIHTVTAATPSAVSLTPLCSLPARNAVSRHEPSLMLYSSVEQFHTRMSVFDSADAPSNNDFLVTP